MRPGSGRPSHRVTNQLVALLLVLAAATGIGAYASGTPGVARWVVAAHGAIGLALLTASPAKRLVVLRARRAPRPRRSTAGSVLVILLVLCVATGLTHALGAPGPFLGVTALQVHVGSALLTAVPLLVHVVHHPLRPRTRDMSRRAVLRAAGTAAGGVVAWLAVEGTARATGLPGRARRETGSYERGSGVPSMMPVTQWFTDTVPTRPRDVLVVADSGRRVEVLVAGLGQRARIRAVLDCTGGWFAEQEWSGVLLADLLASTLGGARGSSVDVVSVTGYRRRLPSHLAGDVLLATHVGGQPLTRGHGAPVRLVVPGRRGFWWVKWVERIEVVDQPSWWQFPFPTR